MTQTIAATDDVNRRSWESGLRAYSYRRADALYPAEAAIFAELAPHLPGIELLDLGIGTGRTTLHLASRVKRYVGLDYSPAMIERARLRCPARDLRVADARDLSAFANQSFDIVFFSFNGLDYVDHSGRLAVLAEVARLLRPGGSFVFSSHNRETTIPPAWSPSNIQLAWNPLRSARSLAGYGLGIINHARLAQHQIETTEYSLRNDQANSYGLLTYYIASGAQCEQLSRAGFKDIAIFRLDGRTSQPATTCSDYMLHYVARRV